MNITPDTVILFRIGPLPVNATLFYSWVVMALLIAGSWLVTSRLSTGQKVSRWQHVLEVTVKIIRGQIRDITRQDPDRYIFLLGSLFLYTSLSNLLTVIPGYRPPTGSLNTTGALALCVFVAVPVYGIARSGLKPYLKQYVEPMAFLLPFNVISELSRTLALAVRLFGNVMSGTLIVSILISIVPFFLPAVMTLFSLLIGQIHAYIFTVLAAVYIASGVRTGQSRNERS